ncbi:MAG: hypothetical protein RL264_1488 [Bacteroidota bacterium]
MGIVYSAMQSGSYVLTLGETTGRRKLPIVIGSFEAQSIAYELENVKPSRPLTHDLVRNLCQSFDIHVVEVVVYRFHEGVFYSKIVVEKEGQTSELDSRTSDAVAIAVRMKAPIFTYPNVLEEVTGLTDFDEKISEEEGIDEELPQNEFAKMSVEDLNLELTRAIEEENYERASKLRDEIKNRTV